MDDFSSAKRSWKPKTKSVSMPTTRNTTSSFKKAQQDVDPALPSLFAASIRASPTKEDDEHTTYLYYGQPCSGRTIQQQDRRTDVSEETIFGQT